MHSNKTKILHVDSRYAVHKHGSDVLEFYVPFIGENTYPGEVFKNIVSVELHAIKFQGTFGDDNAEPYIVLDIGELNNTTFSNVPEANRAFAVVHTPHDNFNKLIKFDYHDKVRYFDPPLNSLNRLSFKFYHQGGARKPIDYFSGFVTMIFKIVLN
jgi:hypothetical protein